MSEIGIYPQLTQETSNPQDSLGRAVSSARNLAMRSINFTGTGSESGKRIVPLLTLYDASWFWSAVIMRSPAGYNE